MEQDARCREGFRRQVKSVALYTFRVSWDWSCFLVKHPSKLVPAFKLVLRELPKFRRTLARKVNIDAERSELKKELSRCAAIFEEASHRYQPSDLRALLANVPQGGSRWVALYLLLRAVKPKVVVETGVFAGETTSYILKALSDNGRGFLHSIDMPGQWYVRDHGALHTETLPAGQNPGWLVPNELKLRWNLHSGRSSEKLPSLLENLGEIDVFLHDSEHTYETMAFEFSCAWPHIRPGGFLVSDDVGPNDAFFHLARTEQVEPFVSMEQVGYLKKA